MNKKSVFTLLTSIGVLGLLAGGMMVVEPKYESAEAVANIAMSEYTKLTSTNVASQKEGTLVYMVAGDGFQGVNMSNAARKTKSKAELSIFAINEVRDGKLAISYNGAGYLNLADRVVLNATSVSKTFLDIDSNGYVSYMNGETREYLGYGNSQFEFAPNTIITNLANDALLLYLVPKSEMTAKQQLAYTILTEVGCDSAGREVLPTSYWANIYTAYTALTDGEKADMETYAANEGDVDVLKSAMAKYDYIMSKYKNRTDYPNYLSREEPASPGLVEYSLESYDNTPMITWIIIGTMSFVSIVSFLVIKKRKEQ